MTQPDVLIIGGGIIGCSLALELCREKLRVVVVERGRPGEEASWAAAGMLAPTSEHADVPALAGLAATSASLYASWVEELHHLSGLEVGYSREGTLLVALSEEEAQSLSSVQAGERLSSEQARRLEPVLSDQILASTYLPGDHYVDNRRLLEAVLEAATRCGVEVRSASLVTELKVEAGRASAVRLADGVTLAAAAVVNAAGCWASQLPEVGERLTPTRPIRGQMVMLGHPETSAGRLLHHVVRSPRAYIVPRADGHLLIGSTMEDAGYEKKITASGIAGLLAGGIEIAPALASLPFVEAWAGLRPDSPDHLPILGATDIERYYVATGHFRNGILLAPITAKLLRETILGESPSLPLEAFSPLRFLQR